MSIKKADKERVVCSLKWQTPGRMKLMRSFPVLKSNTGDDSFIAFGSINGNPTSLKKALQFIHLIAFYDLKLAKYGFVGAKLAI